ncbi:hypothetical protein EPUL_004801 [Erysiphe pulchra]|uniref:N-alpha-acetyltransferase 40 n=1 Tax=Erysiphe pulchra TaxID=225359 RepID=A0A2S4PN07_9PEZI|nr:hypothetical protein EPUL_004801 [Erysiphe pulchra]
MLEDISSSTNQMCVDLLGKICSKTRDQLLSLYFPPLSEWQTWIHPQAHCIYEISLHLSSTLSSKDFESCFDLIESTSSDHYKNSIVGWNPLFKRNEMKQQEMKYILVKFRENVQGFMSFMPSYEDGTPVLYCYEIHLLPSLHGTGLALTLMKLLESVAAKIPIIEKVMLTCFTRNTRAFRFYTKIGYEIDPSTPPREAIAKWYKDWN